MDEIQWVVIGAQFSGRGEIHLDEQMWISAEDAMSWINEEYHGFMWEGQNPGKIEWHQEGGRWLGYDESTDASYFVCPVNLTWR